MPEEASKRSGFTAAQQQARRRKGADRQERQRAGFRHRLQGAEEAVRFVVNPGGEIEFVGVADEAVAEGDTPQAVNCDRIVVEVFKLTQESLGVGVEGIDAPIAEVADEQIVAESAKIAGSQGQTPGRVERALRGEVICQTAIGVKYVNETVA